MASLASWIPPQRSQLRQTPSRRPGARKSVSRQSVMLGRQPRSRRQSSGCAKQNRRLTLSGSSQPGLSLRRKRSRPRWRLRTYNPAHQLCRERLQGGSHKALPHLSPNTSLINPQQQTHHSLDVRLWVRSLLARIRPKHQRGLSRGQKGARRQACACLRSRMARKILPLGRRYPPRQSPRTSHSQPLCRHVPPRRAASTTT